MKEMVPASLLALDQYHMNAINQLWGERSWEVNVPVADVAEHYDSAPEVFLLNLNVLVKSVTAQKCDPEWHCKIIIQPSIMSLLSVPSQSCS